MAPSPTLSEGAKTLPDGRWRPSLLARILALVALASLPGMLVNAWHSEALRKEREQGLARDARDIARAAASEHARIIEGGRQLLAALGAIHSVQTRNAEACSGSLARVAAEFPAYAAISAASVEDGRIFCSSLQVGNYVGDRTWFRRALETGGFAVGELVTGRSTGRRVLHIASVVRNDRGEVVAVLGAALDLDRMAAELAGPDARPDAALLVADERGNVLVSLPDRALLETGLPAGLRVLLHGNGPGTANVSWAGAERITGFVPLETRPEGLFVAIGLPVSLGAAEAREWTERVTMALATLASLAAALWLGLGTIRRPLGHLADLATRWRMGDLSARSHLSGSSEIGRLGAAFDAMADAVGRRERALRATLESMRNGVVILDGAWRVTFLSRRGRALLRQQRDIVGLPLLQAMPVLAGTAFEEACRRCMSARAPVEIEDTEVLPGRIFSVWASPAEDGGVSVFFRDVTEEHDQALMLAEAEALASERYQELAQIYRFAPVGLVALDRDLRCLRLNERMAGILGLPEDQAGRVGARTAPALPPELVERCRPVLQHGEALLGIEVQGEAPAAAGVVRTWLASIFPLRAGDGAVTGLVGAVLEITERKQAEERLRELEARQSFLLRLGDALRPIQDAAAIQAEACRLLGVQLGVAQVGFAPIDARQQHVVVQEDWNDGRIPSVVGTWRMDDFGPDFVCALKRGETVAIADVTRDARTNAPRVAAAYAAIRTRAILDVPLLRDGRMVAMLFIHHPEPRDWTPCEVSLVEEVCQRLWGAVERAAAETALRASEARYRTLTEAGSHLTWVMRPDGTLSFVSRSWRAFTGVEDTEVGQTAWLACVHPDDRARLLETVAPYHAAGLAHTARFRMRRADGAWRWLLARAEPVRDAADTVLEWIGTLVDVHDEVEAQFALIGAEERLRLALEAADLATWDHILGSDEALWSPGHFTLLGYAPDPDCRATVGMWADRVHPDDLPSVLAAWRAAETGDGRFHAVYRAVRPDGRLLWLEGHGRMLELPDGRRRFLGVVQDVTAAEAARVRLADAEERLRLALEGTDEGLWDWNIATGEVWFNDRWQTMLGYAPGEVPGHVSSWEALVHPDDMEEVRRVLAAHLEGRTPLYACEHRVRHRDGSWVWLLDRGKVVLRDQAGRPLRAVGTHQDITRRKAAEDAQAASEARLRSVVDTAADGILLADAEGRIISANPAATRMFGHEDAAGLVGTNIASLMPPEEAAAHPAYLDAHLRRNRLNTPARALSGSGRDLVARRRDGTTFPVEIAVASFTSGSERLFTGVIRDISQRKAAEATLRDNEERFRLLVDSVADYAIVMLDAEGRIASWNTGAQRITGWTDEEVLGCHYAMLLPPELQEEARQGAGLEAARRDGVFRSEGERLRHDGTTFVAEVTLNALLDENGQPRGFAKVTRDITARRAAEARLSALQAETMRASRLTASGAMAAGLAHELNQPLSAIANYASAARMALQRAQAGGGAGAQALARAMGMLDSAAGQAERAGDIIRRLREFVGQAEAELTAQPAGLLVARACEEATAARRPGPDGTPPWRLDVDVPEVTGDVYGDAVQLQLVLANLIRNALDAVGGGGGRVRVSAARLPEDAGVEFCVADDGPGITPGVASRLFEPFVSTKPTGMGIGLAICRTIVEAHGGRIWAEPSGALGGAAFRFLIPAPEETAGMR